MTKVPPSSVRRLLAEDGALRRARRRWRISAGEEISQCRASLEGALEASLAAAAVSGSGTVASPARALCSIVGCGRPVMEACSICNACWLAETSDESEASASGGDDMAAAEAVGTAETVIKEAAQAPVE